METLDSSTQSFIFYTKDTKIIVLAPTLFTELVLHLLSGWRVDKVDDIEACIALRYLDNQWQIDSIICNSTIIRNDLVDAVNIFFLLLVYNVKRLQPSSKLIHCAGYEQNNENTLVLGTHGSGKSMHVITQGILGNKVLADDLVLFYPRRGLFATLGLPIRLRRPIGEFIENYFNASDLLVGSQIAYVRKNAIPVAPAGEVFSLDKFEQFDHDGVKNISIFSVLRHAKKYVLGDHFSSVKKNSKDFFVN